MCVDWIAYILLYVNWIDIESECWWIVLKLIELYVIVEKWWIWKWILIMCLLCELLLRSGELKVIVNDLFWHLIDLCIDVEKLWFWYMLSWGLGYRDMMKEWFELLRLWIWNLLNWIESMNYVNCLCLMVMSWLFKWLINMW